ncbi:hypothetical protein [Rhizosphaericola mali]|uniref:TonB-dependent receptor plug domain-containing protein n=1 Tax=Rhizosphaericola mali TaxID=2545455 RepID=A0A5P2GG93_9BACT|nr:hypothetical protein [Rhizosphaericola mali]QES90731.1 hypothetical protein E0W69_019425 [Rhizosphaericola mali]
MKDTSIDSYIDSLKIAIFQDTLKFNRTDLLHTNMGTRNTQSYSPIYIVNMRYMYNLDIINGTLVKEFVNNILNPSKIQTIEILDTLYSQSLFGTRGINGAILITTKKKAKLNFKIAGLKWAKNKKYKYGNNFDQRQGNEIKILY